MSLQKTIAETIIMKGVGLHSGAEVELRVEPAEADAGITFTRTDVTDKNPTVPARYDLVTDTKLGTDQWCGN